MAYLNSERPPEKWTTGYFKMFVERLRTAVNFLDAENFPDGLSGDVLVDKTVLPGALASYEYDKVLIAGQTAYAVTSVTDVSVGGSITWTPSYWNGAVKMILEVFGGSATSAATATFSLVDSSGNVYAAISSASGSSGRIRSTAFSPPPATTGLVLKVRTSDTLVAANIVSARVLIIPN